MGQVPLEGFHRHLCKLYCPATPLGLRVAKDQASLVTGKRAPHLNDTVLKVHILPLEPRSSPCLSPVVRLARTRPRNVPPWPPPAGPSLACCLLSGHISS